METPIKKEDELPNEAPKKIEVDPGVLSGILGKLESLEKSNSEKQEQIETLRDAVGRYKLEQAESKMKPTGLPSAKLMLYEGKVVVAFEMVKNKYTYNPLAPNTVVGEDLKIIMTYLDGTKSPEVSYNEFFNTKPRVEVVKVGGGSDTWLVEFVDKSISEKQLEILVKYLNP